MQRGEDPVSRQRGMKCSYSRVRIAYFADQNDVWILPEDRSQRPGKGKACLFINRHLADAVHLVFDWIFDRDNVYRLMPDLIHEGIKSCRLSAAGRPYRKQDSLRTAYQAMQPFLDP